MDQNFFYYHLKGTCLNLCSHYHTVLFESQNENDKKLYIFLHITFHFYHTKPMFIGILILFFI